MNKDNENKIQVTVNVDSEIMMQDIIFSAFRYALGRHTYIVSTTVNFLIANINVIDDVKKSLMVKEIEEYFADRNKDKISMDFDMDYQLWNDLQDELLQSINKYSKNKR